MATSTAGDATVARAGPSSSGVEARLRDVASDLLAAHPRPLRKPARAAENRAMGALANRPAVRAALFRLVDVAPACRNDSDLAGHLLGLMSEVRPARDGVALGRLARLPGARRVLARCAALGIRRMARRFIVAETARGAVPALRSLWETGVAASLDLLGERTVTSAEADRYAQRCLAAIRDLGSATSAWPQHPHLERDDAGELPRANLSVKVTALTPELRPHAPSRGISDARPRLRQLLRAAREEGTHLHIDMESFDSRDAVLELALELLAEPEFARGPSAGVVLQAYLADAEPQLARMLEWARAVDREPPLTVRLVKGAYWDHEMVEAGLRGWESPVLARKHETDRSFEALTRRLIDARGLVRTAIGSHNIRSVAYALAYCDQVGAGEQAVEFQILRGLGEEMQAALAAHGLRVRAYCPVGELVAGMAYLVRRLLENSSNDSFLVQRALGRDLEALIAPPGPQGVEA
jgi:RHH-type proline utilization regulon transcriptional repressor/proline dehydrogenase/delta 1-pyrroline-5-carboxylate dehydrogenase